MSTDDIDIKVNNLISKIKYHLITTIGVTLEEASDEEFFRAIALAIREEIMINWASTFQTIQKLKPRILYYLCMEYLPGRMLENNITNIHANELVQRVMKKVHRDYKKILSIERDPALGNGGLGRLASCLLDSLATQQYPAIGYGLRYHYGIFEQEIWNGMQIERPEAWLIHQNPWEFRRNGNAVNVYYSGQAVPFTNKKGVEAYNLVAPEKVRAMCLDIPIVGYQETPDFSVISLRIWTTKESPRNFLLQRYNAGFLDQANENISLTDVLYPNDNHELGKRVRLKQEYLLAAASVRDILIQFQKNVKDIKLLADKVRIHINDSHPAWVIAELMHLLLKEFDFEWGEAFEVVRSCVNYTNHSILKEALEEWNEERVEELLPCQYRIIQRLNEDFCREIRTKFPGDEQRVRRMSIIQGGQIRMAHLNIYASHRVNGVANLHTEILKEKIFADFFTMYPEKFVNVTNGITQRRWINDANPRLAEFIGKCIGKNWITNLKEIEELSKFASDPNCQKEFIEIKKANKRDFISYVKKANPLRDQRGNIFSNGKILDQDALYDVHIKRIHEYKRQLMNALHVLMLYFELKENPNARAIKRMVIIGGKAAPGYFMAKNVIRFIFCLSRKIHSDSNVNEKLCLMYYENYNATKAEKIIPAADLSEQISCAGTEASGTGNMKLSLNGALTISTEDGASIEMHKDITDAWWPFSFGQSAEENEKMRREGSYHSRALYESNPKIKRCLDALVDRSLVEDEEEHRALEAIYHSLLDPINEEIPDRYFVLNDLLSFYEMQKKVEVLFQNPLKWAEIALQNIAHMGRFSVDRAVDDYAKFVWDLLPCPIDKQIMGNVKQQYNEYDRYRIS